MCSRACSGCCAPYDPRLLGALELTMSAAEVESVSELTVYQLRDGMRLTQDVVTHTGMLLVGRGHVVTEQMLQRIRHHAHAIVEPLYAAVPAT